MPDELADPPGTGSSPVGQSRWLPSTVTGYAGLVCVVFGALLAATQFLNGDPFAPCTTGGTCLNVSPLVVAAGVVLVAIGLAVAGIGRLLRR